MRAVGTIGAVLAAVLFTAAAERQLPWGEGDVLSFSEKVEALQRRQMVEYEDGLGVKRTVLPDAHRGRGLAQAGSALRIQFVYQLGGIDAALEDYIRDVTERAGSVLGHYLQVKQPLAGTTPITAAAAGDPCVDATFGGIASAGITAGDTLVFVSYDGAACNPQALAYSGLCVVDNASGRPLVGGLTWCPTVTADTSGARFQTALEVAVHELLHVLVMNDVLFGEYRQADGIRKKLRSSVITFIGSGRMGIVTPKVVEAAREQLGCPELTGAELENAGGAGVAGVHWEERLFQGEMMDPTRPHPSDWQVTAAKHRITKLTLALAEDSGWYNPVYSAAGHNPFGFEGGCAFALPENALQCNSDKYYCTQETDKTKEFCTADFLTGGRCIVDLPTFDGCGFLLPNPGLDCLDPTHHRGTKWPDGTPTNLWGGYFGNEASRCIHEVRSSRIMPTCYQLRCDGKNLELGFNKGDQDNPELLWLSCPETQAGQVVHIRQSAIGREIEGLSLPRLLGDAPTLRCPDNTPLCDWPGYLTCDALNHCNKRGDCVSGSCHCYVGFIGADCSTEMCSSRTCGAGKRCDSATAQCVDADSTPPPATDAPTAAPDTEEPTEPGTDEPTATPDPATEEPTSAATRPPDTDAPDTDAPTRPSQPGQGGVSAPTTTSPTNLFPGAIDRFPGISADNLSPGNAAVASFDVSLAAIWLALLTVTIPLLAMTLA